MKYSHLIRKSKSKILRRRTNHSSRIDYSGAGAAHFGDGVGGIAGFEVDPAASVFDHMNVEPELAGVEDRELDAVIRRQAHDVNVAYTARLQVNIETGRA